MPCCPHLRIRTVLQIAISWPSMGARCTLKGFLLVASTRSARTMTPTRAPKGTVRHVRTWNKCIGERLKKRSWLEEKNATVTPDQVLGLLRRVSEEALFQFQTLGLDKESRTGWRNFVVIRNSAALQWCLPLTEPSSSWSGSK